MKRSLIALCLLVVFAVACASTTATAPQLRGVVTEKEGNVLTVTPAAGGEATAVTVSRSTRVYWQNGEEAGRSVLMKGHPVQVWLKDGSKDASKVVIAP